MNANEIWSGQLYAYVPYAKRKVTYLGHAVPVRVMRKYKEQLPGNTQKTTLLEVLFVTDDDEFQPKTDYNGNEVTKDRVPAANLYMRWDEHSRERDKRRAEQAERETIAREAREAQERIWAQRRQEEELERQRREEERQRVEKQKEFEAERLLNYLDLRIPRDIVIGVRDVEVILNREKLEKFLKIKKMEVA